MEEVLHERLKSPIPKVELERRSKELLEVIKREGLDCIIAENITLYMGGFNRWMTDTTAEVQYPQSSILTKEGDILYIACSGPPQELYPPPHLVRIGKHYATAPYFSVFNFTNDWEGKIVERWVKENNAKKIGIAGFSMFGWNFYEYLRDNLPGVEIVDVAPLIDKLRAVKSKDEITFIRKSASVMDKVMGFVTSIARPGVREYEIRNRIVRAASDHGCEKTIVIMGSGPKDEPIDLFSHFYQNRTLKKGDQLYIKLAISGPGGYYTTLGRLFSIGCAPSAAMQANWEAALAAQNKLVSMLQVGMDTQAIYTMYNEYLTAGGYATERGGFSHGQGYDHIERPSIQPGETMNLAADMCMAVNTSLISDIRTCYCADSFMLHPDGPERIHKTPQIIFSV